MLAASKPCDRKTARAPSKIWRRLALSSGPAVWNGRTATAASLVICIPLGRGHRPHFDSLSRNMAYSHANINDRTVRSILTRVHGLLYMIDRTVRSLPNGKEIWSTAMYLDREEGIGLPRRTESRRAAADVVEAKAPLDPEILRRWRSPDADPPTEQPDAPRAEPEVRRSLPAVIDIPAAPVPSEEKPRPRRIS